VLEITRKLLFIGSIIYGHLLRHIIIHDVL